MRLITRQILANTVADSWATQYSDKAMPDKDAILIKLCKLGENPDPDTVDKLIGNDSWTRTSCSECGVGGVDVVDCEYEDEDIMLCGNCLRCALSIIGEGKKALPINDYLREVLCAYLPYHQAAAVMELLHDMSKATYQPKYPDLYLEFMNANKCSFSENHPQETNKPYYFTLFTVVSQHVMGDCVEECLDKAIEIAQAKQ